MRGCWLLLVIGLGCARREIPAEIPVASVHSDPLEGARIMLLGNAREVVADEVGLYRRRYLAAHPGAAGYIDFADWSTRWLGDPNALPSPFEVDSDGDNRITLAELQAAMARVFARLDVDKDGAVTRKECLTIRSMAPRAPDPRGGKRKR